MEEKLRQAIEYIEKKERHFRIGPSGLLMRTGSRNYVASRLAQRARDARDGILGKKDSRELLDSMNKGQFYIEAPWFWVANLLDTTPPFPEDIPEAEGRVLSCQEFLHPQDPIFGGGMIFTGEDEYPIRLNTKHGEYDLSNHAFKRFCDRAPDSEQLWQAVESCSNTKRGLVRLLLKQFNGSFPVERKNSASQIIKHGFRPTEYRMNKNWIYVVEDGDKIKTCYEKEDPNAAGYRKVQTQESRG
jgi:hypothetical protein